MVPHNFDRSVNPVSSRVGRLYILANQGYVCSHKISNCNPHFYTHSSWHDNLYGTGGILAKAMRGHRCLRGSANMIAQLAVWCFSPLDWGIYLSAKQLMAKFKTALFSLGTVCFFSKFVAVVNRSSMHWPSGFSRWNKTWPTKSGYTHTSILQTLEISHRL